MKSTRNKVTRGTRLLCKENVKADRKSCRGVQEGGEIEIQGPFKKESGLKVDDNLFNQAEILMTDLDELYVKLINDRAKIMKDRLAGSNSEYNKSYAANLEKAKKLQKSLNYLQDLIRKHIESIYGVVSSDWVNMIIMDNEATDHRMFALAGYLPDQKGITEAIINGNLSVLKWWANPPRYVLPDQNNINIAQMSGQWEILNWLAAPPYNKRPNNNKVIVPPAITIYSDIESVYGYTIEKKVGEGGFGAVYKARDPQGKVVALKFMNPDRNTASDLAQEVGLLVELSKNGCHKNIVCYYGMFDASFLGKPVRVISMQYIDGTELNFAFKNRSGPLPVEVARPIVKGLLDGLKFIHDKHIYHLDIKEANILLAKDTLAPVYVDFGVGCEADVTQKPYACDTASIGGTRSYMSKNRKYCRSLNKCTEKDYRYADIWALGLVLFQVLNGKTLSSAENDLLRYDAIADYIAKNVLYPLDPNINDIIRTALSGDIGVTVDDLLKIFNRPAAVAQQHVLAQPQARTPAPTQVQVPARAPMPALPRPTQAPLAQGKKPTVHDLYKKDIAKCDKGPAAGGYDMPTLKMIANQIGVPTEGRLKKDICDDLKALL